MTPTQIEQLALEAGIAITAAGMVIDGRKLSRFAAIVRAAALEEAAHILGAHSHQIRALALKAGGERGGEKPC